MRISKYHGCGNSFVIIKEEDVAVKAAPENYGELALAVCDANTGVGADGMIVVRREPELEMVFYNRDGSRAPMCGNGIRCFAHFCRNEGICGEDRYPVKTLAGEMIVEITSAEPFRVRIDMGEPVFSPAAINVDSGDENYLGRRLALADGSRIEVDSFFMGTVHTVVFVDSIAETDVEGLGKELCEHPVFKEKTNVNFVEAVDDRTLRVRTYERGVGVTLACGTGACASVVAAHMRGLCGKSADVVLELGRLAIGLADDGHVYMEGPSTKIFDGELK